MPALHVGQKSSILLSSTKFTCLAQLVEHCIDNAAVLGSNPRAGTIVQDTFGLKPH